MPSQAHYAANLRGDYVNAAAVGFNLMDVGNKATMDSLPDGVRGLMWVGNGYNTTCSWAIDDATLTSIVTACRNDPKFCNIYYISDEPHHSVCPDGPAALASRTALIKSLDPGARTFAIIQDGSSHPGEFQAFANTIDYIGVDPYPFNANNIGGADLTSVRDRINTALQYIPANRLVPVFQTFGQECATVAQYYRMPTAAELTALLAIYDELIPRSGRPFDFCYTWSAQGTTSCPGLQDSPELRDVMYNYFQEIAPPPPPVTPLPVYVVSGTASNVAVGTNPTPSYPAGMKAGDLALLQIYKKNDAAGTLTPPSDWSLIGGGESTNALDSHSVYKKVLTGSETGNVSVVSTGAAGRRAAWIHVFSSSGGSDWRFEDFNSEASPAQSTTVWDNDVTTTGTNRLAINLIGYTNVQTTTGQEIFSGTTGGKWTARAFSDTGSAPTLSLQTADMANAGTVGGGTDTSIFAGSSIVLGFAIYSSQGRISPPSPSVIRGFHFTSLDANDLVDSTTTASRIDAFRSQLTSETHACLDVFVRVPGGATSNTVARDSISEDPTHLAAWFALVVNRGILPCLQINLFADNSSLRATNWNPANPDTALASYYTAIRPYVLAAQSAGLEFIVIANELSMLFSNVSAITAFTTLMNSARADYSGNIAFGVNGLEEDNIRSEILALADLIAVSAFIPIANTDSPTIDQMFVNLTGPSQILTVKNLVDSKRAAWGNPEVVGYMSYLRVLSARWGRKLILTTGYKSTVGAARDPYNQTETTEDDVIQSNAWKAFLNAVFDSNLGINNGMLQGILGWRWYPSGAPASVGANIVSYPIYGTYSGNLLRVSAQELLNWQSQPFGNATIDSVDSNGQRTLVVTNNGSVQVWPGRYYQFIAGTFHGIIPQGTVLTGSLWVRAVSGSFTANCFVGTLNDGDWGKYVDSATGSNATVTTSWIQLYSQVTLASTNSNLMEVRLNILSATAGQKFQTRGYCIRKNNAARPAFNENFVTLNFDKGGTETFREDFNGTSLNSASFLNNPENSGNATTGNVSVSGGLLHQKLTWNAGNPKGSMIRSPSNNFGDGFYECRFKLPASAETWPDPMWFARPQWSTNTYYEYSIHEGNCTVPVNGKPWSNRLGFTTITFDTNSSLTWDNDPYEEDTPINMWDGNFHVIWFWRGIINGKQFAASGLDGNLYHWIDELSQPNYSGQRNFAGSNFYMYIDILPGNPNSGYGNTPTAAIDNLEMQVDYVRRVTAPYTDISDPELTDFSIQNKPAAAIISSGWSSQLPQESSKDGFYLKTPTKRFGTFAGIDSNISGYSASTGNQYFWDSIISAPPWAQRDAVVPIREINTVGDIGGSGLAGTDTFSKRAEWLKIWGETKFSIINNCELEVVDPIKGGTGSQTVTGVGTIGTGDDGLIWSDTTKPTNARWRLSVIANRYPGAFPLSTFMVGNEPDGNVNRYCAYAPAHVGATNIGNFTNCNFINTNEALRRLVLLAKNAYCELKTDNRFYTKQTHPSVITSFANTAGAMNSLTSQGANTFNVYEYFNYNSGEILKYCQVIPQHFHNRAAEFNTPAPSDVYSPWHLWTALHQGQTAANTGYVHPVYCNEGGWRRGNEDSAYLQSVAPIQQTQWNEPPTASNRLARGLLKVRRQGMMVCTIFYWAWQHWILYNHNGSADDGMIWCPSYLNFAAREPEWTAIRRQFNPSFYLLRGKSPWSLAITAKPWCDLTNVETQGRVGFHDPATWAVLGDLWKPEKADPASSSVRTWYEWDRAEFTDNKLSFTPPVSGQGNQTNRAMRPVILPGHGRYYVVCDVGGNTGTARLIARGYNALDGLATTLGQSGSSTTAATGSLICSFDTVPHNVKNFPNLPKVAVVLECTAAAQFSDVYIFSKPPATLLPIFITASAVPTSGVAPLTVAFSASASGGIGGYLYSWNFGDGSTSASASINHTYSSVGPYNVLLTVSSSGQIATWQTQIIVTVTTTIGTGSAVGRATVTAVSKNTPANARATGTVIVLAQKMDPLVVTLTPSTQSGTVPLTVTFTASATGAVGGYTYAWAFGDGGVANGTPVNHTYSSSGTFNATVTARSGDQSAQKSVSIVVSPTGTVQDLFLNPFNKNGVHHMPVGDGAQFVSDSDPITQAWLRIPFNYLNADNGWGANFYKNTTADPVRTVIHIPGDTMFSDPQLPFTARMPFMRQPEVGNETSDSDLSFIDLTGDGMIHEFYRWRWNNGSPQASGHRTIDPRGLGHAPGVTAAGMPTLFGLQRGFEINDNAFGPIEHAMHFAITGYSSDGLANRIIWPARYKDNFCNGSTACYGPIPYGACFAIPRNVSSSGRGLSALGLRLWDQVRNYGVFIIEQSSGTTARGDQEITTAKRDEFIAQMKIIHPYMRYIYPNITSTQTVKGGGNPLARNSAFDA